MTKLVKNLIIGGSSTTVVAGAATGLGIGLSHKQKTNNAKSAQIEEQKKELAIKSQKIADSELALIEAKIAAFVAEKNHEFHQQELLEIEKKIAVYVQEQNTKYAQETLEKTEAEIAEWVKSMNDRFALEQETLRQNELKSWIDQQNLNYKEYQLQSLRLKLVILAQKKLESERKANQVVPEMVVPYLAPNLIPVIVPQKTPRLVVQLPMTPPTVISGQREEIKIEHPEVFTGEGFPIPTATGIHEIPFIKPPVDVQLTPHPIPVMHIPFMSPNLIPVIVPQKTPQLAKVVIELTPSQPTTFTGVSVIYNKEVIIGSKTYDQWLSSLKVSTKEEKAFLRRVNAEHRAKVEFKKAVELSQRLAHKQALELWNKEISHSREVSARAHELFAIAEGEAYGLNQAAKELASKQAETNERLKGQLANLEKNGQESFENNRNVEATKLTEIYKVASSALTNNGSSQALELVQRLKVAYTHALNAINNTKSQKELIDAAIKAPKLLIDIFTRFASQVADFEIAQTRDKEFETKQAQDELKNAINSIQKGTFDSVIPYGTVSEPKVEITTTDGQYAIPSLKVDVQERLAKEHQVEIAEENEKAINEIITAINQKTDAELGAQFAAQQASRLTKGNNAEQVASDIAAAIARGQQKHTDTKTEKITLAFEAEMKRQADLAHQAEIAEENEKAINEIIAAINQKTDAELEAQFAAQQVSRLTKGNNAEQVASDIAAAISRGQQKHTDTKTEKITLAFEAEMKRQADLAHQTEISEENEKAINEIITAINQKTDAELGAQFAAQQASRLTKGNNAEQVETDLAQLKHQAEDKQFEISQAAKELATATGNAKPQSIIPGSEFGTFTHVEGTVSAPTAIVAPSLTPEVQAKQMEAGAKAFAEAQAKIVADRVKELNQAKIDNEMHEAAIINEGQQRIADRNAEFDAQEVKDRLQAKKEATNNAGALALQIAIAQNLRQAALEAHSKQLEIEEAKKALAALEAKIALEVEKANDKFALDNAKEMAGRDLAAQFQNAAEATAKANSQLTKGNNGDQIESQQALAALEAKIALEVEKANDKYAQDLLTAEKERLAQEAEYKASIEADKAAEREADLLDKKLSVVEEWNSKMKDIRAAQEAINNLKESILEQAKLAFEPLKIDEVVYTNTLNGFANELNSYSTEADINNFAKSIGQTFDAAKAEITQNRLDSYKALMVELIDQSNMDEFYKEELKRNLNLDTDLIHVSDLSTIDNEIFDERLNVEDSIVDFEHKTIVDHMVQVSKDKINLLAQSSQIMNPTWREWIRVSTVHAYDAIIGINDFDLAPGKIASIEHGLELQVLEKEKMSFLDWVKEEYFDEMLATVWHVETNSVKTQIQQLINSGINQTKVSTETLEQYEDFVWDLVHKANNLLVDAKATDDTASLYDQGIGNEFSNKFENEQGEYMLTHSMVSDLLPTEIQDLIKQYQDKMSELKIQEERYRFLQKVTYADDSNQYGVGNPLDMVKYMKEVTGDSNAYLKNYQDTMTYFNMAMAEARVLYDARKQTVEEVTRLEKEIATKTFEYEKTQPSDAIKALYSTPESHVETQSLQDYYNEQFIREAQLYYFYLQLGKYSEHIRDQVEMYSKQFDQNPSNTEARVKAGQLNGLLARITNARHYIMDRTYEMDDHLNAINDDLPNDGKIQIPSYWFSSLNVANDSFVMDETFTNKLIEDFNKLYEARKAAAI